MRGGDNGQGLNCELEGRFLCGTWVSWLDLSLADSSAQHVVSQPGE